MTRVVDALDEGYATGQVDGCVGTCTVQEATNSLIGAHENTNDLAGIIHASGAGKERAGRIESSELTSIVEKAMGSNAVKEFTGDLTRIVDTHQLGISISVRF